MARRSNITREYIFEICQYLTDKGENPTVNKIREHAGSGSFSTISALLDEWREASQKGNAAEAPTVPDTVDTAFRRIWAEAWNAAQEVIEAERKALARTREQMEREHKEMAEEIAKLEQTLEEGHTERQKTTVELEKAHKETHSLEICNARLEERLTAFEKDLDKAQAEATQATASLGNLTTENTRLATKLEAAEAQLATEQSRTERLEAQLAEIATGKKPAPTRTRKSTKPAPKE